MAISLLLNDNNQTYMFIIGLISTIQIDKPKLKQNTDAM